MNPLSIADNQTHSMSRKIPSQRLDHNCETNKLAIQELPMNNPSEDSNQSFCSFTTILAEQSETSIECRPQLYDVILARGRSAFNHPGNIRFRRLMAERIYAYSTANGKGGKSEVVSDIIDQVRMRGSFVKKNPKTGYFERVSERVTREKVGQGLRDALHNKYKSSNKAKTRKRIDAEQFQNRYIEKMIAQNRDVSEIIAAVSRQVFTDEDDMTSAFLKANICILEKLKASNAAGEVEARARLDTSKSESVIEIR